MDHLGALIQLGNASLLGLAIPALTWGFVAEREGFEPPGRLHARLLSRQLQSTRLCHRSSRFADAGMTGQRPCRLSYQVRQNLCGEDIQPAAGTTYHKPDYPSCGGRAQLA